MNIAFTNDHVMLRLRHRNTNPLNSSFEEYKTKVEGINASGKYVTALKFENKEVVTFLIYTYALFRQ